ncbi:MAG: DUF1573 domain-containing protein [Saprospiraceae bacterium]|nr:DUF1573 domain-containing protein [Saprospiraceae bacterium]
MKNILYTLTLCLFAGIAFSQDAATAAPATAKSGPAMQLASDVVDYGEILQNSDPVRKVKFTNTGTEPLIIKNAQGSFGCTIPSWPKEPIMPGETSEIEIHYATDRIGVIMKTVTVTTNEEGVSHVIQVKGNVKVKPAEESVPAKQASLLSPAKKSGPVNQ